MPSIPTSAAPPPPPDPAVRKLFFRRLGWAVGACLVAIFVAWFVFRGGLFSPDPFIQEQLAPGIHGVVEGAAKASRGIILLLPTDGYSRAVAERAAALRQMGAATLVLDYYRGGRDSYHGYTNESSADLEAKWVENIRVGLSWAAGDARFAHRAILVWPGRTRQLAAVALAPLPDPEAWPVLDASLDDQQIFLMCEAQTKVW